MRGEKIEKGGKTREDFHNRKWEIRNTIIWKSYYWKILALNLMEGV